MTKEKKIALVLAGTVLLGASPSTLTGCQKKEEMKEEVQVSETSIDTKDIIVIDTFHSEVISRGINSRYLILYKVDTQENKEFSTEEISAISYVFRDINNQDYVGVITEFINRDSEEVLTRMLAYSKEDMTDQNTTIIVKPTKDKSWYANLENVIEKSSLKVAYEIYELKEIYNLINEGYIKEDDQTTYGSLEDLSYIYKID